MDCAMKCLYGAVSYDIGDRRIEDRRTGQSFMKMSGSYILSTTFFNVVLLYNMQEMDDEQDHIPKVTGPESASLQSIKCSADSPGVLDELQRLQQLSS